MPSVAPRRRAPCRILLTDIDETSSRLATGHWRVAIDPVRESNEHEIPRSRDISRHQTSVNDTLVAAGSRRCPTRRSSSRTFIGRQCDLHRQPSEIIGPLPDDIYCLTMQPDPAIA